jgi:hypothetical protein
MATFIFNNNVLLNERLEHGKNSTPLQIPSNNTLIITDIVIQNRAPGDAPVNQAQFSSICFSNIAENIGEGFFLTVVGNDTLNLHFKTGVPVRQSHGIQPPQHLLQVQNVGNSTAPFVEVLITGFLVPTSA